MRKIKAIGQSLDVQNLIRMAQEDTSYFLFEVKEDSPRPANFQFRYLNSNSLGQLYFTD